MRRLAYLVLLALPVGAPAAPASVNWTGVWRNASDSVHIRTARCGRSRSAGMCGTVVWASDRARADVAARGRTLVGMRLFSGFREGPGGLWQGRVTIPDLGRELTGTILVKDRDTIVGRGCALGGLACKTQRWTRVRPSRR